MKPTSTSIRTGLWDPEAALAQGTINRFTGELEITFHDAPAEGIQVKATYSYYSPQGLALFNTTNVDSQMLNLTDEFIHGEGFT